MEEVTTVKELREFINKFDRKYDEYEIIQGYDCNYAFEDINIHHYIIDDYNKLIRLLDGDYSFKD